MPEDAEAFLGTRPDAPLGDKTEATGGAGAAPPPAGSPVPTPANAHQLTSFPVPARGRTARTVRASTKQPARHGNHELYLPGYSLHQRLDRLYHYYADFHRPDAIQRQPTRRQKRHHRTTGHTADSDDCTRNARVGDRAGRLRLFGSSHGHHGCLVVASLGRGKKQSSSNQFRKQPETDWLGF